MRHVAFRRLTRALLLFAVALRGAAAQDAAGISLLGRVLREEDRPVPFARVTLTSLASGDAASREVLAGSDGRFVLRDVPEGAYRVVARQLGFRPQEAQVTVGGDASAPLTLRLERLAIALPAIVVAAGAQSCEEPAMQAGRDDPRLEALRALLAENGARIRALSAYPVESRFASRETFFLADGGVRAVQHDTVTAAIVSGAPEYRPGTVIRRGRAGSDESPYMIAVPGANALGSESFQRNHCFAFGGEEVVAGRRALRLLVAPALEALRTTDVAGTYFLDAESGVLLRSELTLTRLPRNASFTNVTLVTEYAEPIPGLALRWRVTNLQEYRPRRRATSESIVRAEQLLETLEFRFVGARPDGFPQRVEFPSGRP